MKTKVVAVFMAMLFLFASSAVALNTTDDTAPPVKVVLEMWKLDPFKITKINASRWYVGSGWYFVRVSIKNLCDERITLGVAKPAGGFVVYDWMWWLTWNILYQKPRNPIILILVRLTLRPHQTKVINFGLWNTEWHRDVNPNGYHLIIQGFLYGFEYNGKTYPYTTSRPICIKPN